MRRSFISTPQLKELLICSGNHGKIAELRTLIPSGCVLKGLSELGLPMELPETGSTLEENALQKARYAFDRTMIACVADDSGLEVDALGGAPGVYSARFAGEAKDPIANMSLLIKQLEGLPNRTARFRTVIALVWNGGERLFEGIVHGRIAGSALGQHGFGYDPIFIPENSDRTFAQMSADEKNLISHRAQAVRKLVEYLADVHW